MVLLIQPIAHSAVVLALYCFSSQCIIIISVVSRHSRQLSAEHQMTLVNIVEHKLHFDRIKKTAELLRSNKLNQCALWCHILTLREGWENCLGFINQENHNFCRIVGEPEGRQIASFVSHVRFAFKKNYTLLLSHTVIISAHSEIWSLHFNPSLRRSRQPVCSSWEPTPAPSRCCTFHNTQNSKLFADHFRLLNSHPNYQADKWLNSLQQHAAST